MNRPLPSLSDVVEHTTDVRPVLLALQHPRDAPPSRRVWTLQGTVPGPALHAREESEQLLEDEVGCYPDPSAIDPTLLGFSMLGGEGMNLVRVLDMASEDEFLRSREKYWHDGAPDIVEGIASLVANFPPDRDSYGRDEVRHFVEIAGFSQVAMRQHDFAKQMVEIESQAVTIDAFPSVKATVYAVWHKFYADRNRTWTRSDAFDIIIASATPYVDAVVTESHLAEGLRKTKRLDDFIERLTIYTLRDFRQSAPGIVALDAAR